MSGKQSPITEVIDRSSLGTPAVRKLRRRTTRAQKAAIREKAAARDSGRTVTKRSR